MTLICHHFPFSATLSSDEPAKTPSLPAVTPSLMITSTLPVQVTPLPPQPGSQEEKIEALEGLDEPTFSEKGDDDTESDEMTLQQKVDKQLLKSGSSGSAKKEKRHTKRVAHKKKLVHGTSPTTPKGTTKDGASNAPVSSSSTKTSGKLTSKPGKGSGEESKKD